MTSTGTPRHLNRHTASPQPARGAGDLSDRSLGVIDGSDPASASEAVSFALSAPTLDEPPKPKPPRRKPKPEGADPEQGAKHAKVVKFYFETFERKRGTKPTFDGGDGKAVTRLLAKCSGDAERACEAIAGAFADDWTAARTSIRAIANDPAKFIGVTPRKANGRGTPTQPNYGVAIDAEEYR